MTNYETPVILNSHSSENDEYLSQCSLCRLEIVSREDSYCPSCGHKKNTQCHFCHKKLKDHHTYCTFCGHRQISIYSLLKYDLLHQHRFHLFAAVSILGVVLTVRLFRGRSSSSPVHTHAHAGPPTPAELIRQAQGWTQWCASWVIPQWG